MWAIFSGTIVNGVTVCVGSLLGLSMAKRLPERYRVIVLQCLGLVTIALGIDAGVLHFADTVKRFGPQVNAGGTYGARLAMVMIGSLLLGALMGTALRLHERIESLGDWIHRRFSSGRDPDGKGSGDAVQTRFAEGFLTASVIFCVGPLTLLGCLQNGAYGDPSLLYIKATLDGFCSMALASALGWGVLASVVTVIVFQGGLCLLAAMVTDPLNDLSLDLMTVVGGVVLLATALMILEIKKIQVANLLPGIFLPPLLVWVVERLSPGLLLPLSTGGS